MSVSGPTILTASGRYVNPLELAAGDVCLEDVAHALANQCRYSGHTRVFYSVAEHSVRVARHLLEQQQPPGLALWGLLHDAAEAYLVDLPRPLKHEPTFGPVYRRAEARAMLAVCDHFDLPPEEPGPVKDADLVLLATERRDLLPPAGDWAVLDGVTPLPDRIVPWPPAEARQRFQATYFLLRSCAEAA